MIWSVFGRNFCWLIQGISFMIFILYLGFSLDFPFLAVLPLGLSSFQDLRNSALRVKKKKKKGRRVHTLMMTFSESPGGLALCHTPTPGVLVTRYSGGWFGGCPGQGREMPDPDAGAFLGSRCCTGSWLWSPPGLKRIWGLLVFNFGNRAHSLPYMLN